MTENSNVQQLIDSIKKEGFEEAGKESQMIIDKAQKQAKEIIQSANDESKNLLKQTRLEMQTLTQSAEKAIQQSGRNLIISLNQQILTLFQKVMEKEIASTFKKDILQTCILQLIEKWGILKSSSNIEILLNEDDLKDLESSLMTALKKELKKGVFLKPLDHIQAGFRIGEKDGHVHYDFTEKGLSEILAGYLNPKIAGFLVNNQESTQNR